MRQHIRHFFVHVIDDGHNVNAWEDTWATSGHLAGKITYRMIYAAGFNKLSTVNDICTNLQGMWPQQWLAQCRDLGNVQFPDLDDNKSDSLRWRTANGDLKDFSVFEAWRALDDHENVLQWCHAIWFPGYIPRHSFCLWLAFRKRLPTQDRIFIWNHEPPDMKCPLCEAVMDSHNHLFFSCSFAKEVWTRIKEYAAMDHFGDHWDAIVANVMDGTCFPIHPMQKLALAAAVYYIWQERNRRCFQGHRRTVVQLVKIISEVVLNRLAWKFRMKTKGLL